MRTSTVTDPFEWAALRVVPRIERGEFVNVAVLLYCQNRDFLAVAMAPDLSRVLALDASVDVTGVTQHLDAVQRWCSEHAGGGSRAAGERFRWLIAPRSSVVQPSPVHTGLTDDPAKDLRRLHRALVLPPSSAQPSAQPSSKPSSKPSAQPSAQPSSQPSRGLPT